MADIEQNQSRIGGPARFSYFFMLGAILLMGWLGLAGPLVVALFTFLALSRLRLPIRGGKWLAFATVLILLSAIAYGLGYFIHATIDALPQIADKAIPAIIAWAKEHGIQLPFTDYDSLKDLAFETVKSQVQFFGNVARFARGASSQLLFLAAACIIAIGLFLNPQFQRPVQGRVQDDNLYWAASAEIAARFKTLHQSFSTVMGAQVIISAINTALTGIFVVVTGLPYAFVIIGMTFLCGLIPVVGNLASNSIVVAIGFTISPKMALVALIFLVLIHKLEYFLNSKIVGWRIHNPFWLTLLALILGERILGIPGMILGPVLLNYLRLEASRFKTKSFALDEALVS